MSIKLMAQVWDEAEMWKWVVRHSDAWHPANRDECEHCQEMIRAFGEMPPADVIRSHASLIPKSAATTKQAIPQDVRWEVWERDNFTCQHCGSRRYLSVDHIVAESNGGANDKSNYQTLCRRCNSRKAAS